MENLLKIVLLFSLLYLGCKEEGRFAATNIDTVLKIQIRNQEGSNLLVETTPDYLDINHIKLYYQDNSEFRLTYLPNSNAPNGFWKSGLEDDPMIAFDFKILEDFDIPDHLIEWEPGNQDTLHFETRSGSNFLSIERVFINGQIKWEDNGFNSRVITLVK